MSLLENTLIKSILLVQKEQFVTLHKDMNYLKSIIREMGQVTKIITEGLDDDMGRIEDYIKIIDCVTASKNLITKNEEKTFFIPKLDLEIVLFIDKNREFLDNILISLHAISKQIQLITYNNYASNEIKPNITRRFSSANFLKVIDKNITSRYGEFIDSEKVENISFLTKSEFISGYEVDRIGEKLYALNLSYWHFDIPLIYNTAISHELGHLVLKKQKTKANFFKLQTECKEFLKSLYASEEYSRDNLGDAEYLADELMSDLIALFYHGSSYILGLFHQIFSYGLRTQVGTGSGKKEYREDDFWDTLKEPYTARTWVIPSPLDRDENFIRLYMLIVAHRSLEMIDEQTDKFQTTINVKVDNKDETWDWINEIEDALFLIYPIGDNQNKTSFLDVYKKYDNLLYEYELLFQLQSDIIKGLTNKYKHVIDIYKKEFHQFQPTCQQQQKEKKENRDNFPIFSNDLWKSWFRAIKDDKIAHKVYFRIKTHNDTISTLNKNETLKVENIKPYKLSYKKSNARLGDDEHHSLGYYNRIELIELDKEFEPTIHQNISNDIMINQSLMQIITPKIGVNCEADYSVLIEVTLPDEVNLAESIRKIIDLVATSLGNGYSKFRIFKTLGPSDLVLFIEDIEIKSIKSLKKAFIDKDEYKTITKILFKKEEVSLEKLSYTTFTSTIRGKLNTENIKEIKANSNSFGMVPGVLDDYTIIWKTEMKYEKINKILMSCQKIDTYTVQIIFLEK